MNTKSTSHTKFVIVALTALASIATVLGFFGLDLSETEKVQNNNSEIVNQTSHGNNSPNVNTMNAPLNISN